MSETGTRIPLTQALLMAEEILKRINGKAWIVGSIRRKKPEVGDIEILLHVDAVVHLKISAGDLFAGEYESIKGGPDSKSGTDWRYWQIRHTESGVNIDLFRCDDDNQGSMALIRTGPSEFSRRFVMALKGNNLCHKDGYIRPIGADDICPCPTEKKAFRFAGMQYIEPENRT